MGTQSQHMGYGTFDGATHGNRSNQETPQNGPLKINVKVKGILALGSFTHQTNPRKTEDACTSSQSKAHKHHAQTA